MELSGASEAAGTKNIDLHKLIAHNVDPGREHTVFDQLRPDPVGQFQDDFVYLAF